MGQGDCETKVKREGSGKICWFWHVKTLLVLRGLSETHVADIDCYVFPSMQVCSVILTSLPRLPLQFVWKTEKCVCVCFLRVHTNLMWTKCFTACRPKLFISEGLRREVLASVGGKVHLETTSALITKVWWRMGREGWIKQQVGRERARMSHWGKHKVGPQLTIQGITETRVLKIIAEGSSLHLSPS